MNVEAFRAYCIAKKGVTEEFPFDEHTLVFKVMGKVFALIPLERVPSQANLKCDPERAIELRETYHGAIIPGYHMNKKHWNTMHLENLDPDLTKELIDHSYGLVIAKLPKKVRSEMEK